MKPILAVLFIAAVVALAVLMLRRTVVPRRLRSVLAVLFGFFVVALSVTLLTMTTARLLSVHAGQPTATYLALNLVYSLAAAVLGGWVTGDLAPFLRVRHGIALAAVMLAFGVMGLVHPAAGQPTVYVFFLAVLPPVVAVFGSWLAPRRVL